MADVCCRCKQQNTACGLVSSRVSVLRHISDRSVIGLNILHLHSRSPRLPLESVVRCRQLGPALLTSGARPLLGRPWVSQAPVRLKISSSLRPVPRANLPPGPTPERGREREDSQLLSHRTLPQPTVGEKSGLRVVGPAHGEIEDLRTEESDRGYCGAVGVLADCRCRTITTSTRRFLARPSSVWLLATGWYSA